MFGFTGEHRGRAERTFSATAVVRNRDPGIQQGVENAAPRRHRDFTAAVCKPDLDFLVIRRGRSAKALEVNLFRRPAVCLGQFAHGDDH